MARYVDVEKLKRNIRINFMPNVDVDGTVTVENAERYFLNLIDKTSTADVEKVKHGYWKDKYGNKYDNHIYFCSVCDKAARYKFIRDELDREKEVQDLSVFCPHCGTKMDGGKRE